MQGDKKTNMHLSFTPVCYARLLLHWSTSLACIAWSASLAGLLEQRWPGCCRHLLNGLTCMKCVSALADAARVKHWTLPQQRASDCTGLR